MLRTLASMSVRLSSYVDARVASWRTGSRGSQAYVLCVLLLGVAASFALAWNGIKVPFSVWFVGLMMGVLVLRFVPLLLLSIAVWTAAITSTIHDGDSVTGSGVVALGLLALSEVLILVQSLGQRSGLPVALSEQVLANLRDRLQSQGSIPELPAGWRSHSSMLSAHGARYAGDFLVADFSDRRHLEMVLVDVSGKGVAVGPQALQFAGALGGLIGIMSPHELLRAANAFLLRQESPEAFATAVHLLVDLDSGHFVLTSAGHPPALHWRASDGAWSIDGARGIALGVIPDADFEGTSGQLAPGEALMLYTDGVVESRERDLDTGIEWLRDAARRAVEPGFEGAARRILRGVPRGKDDRAVLIIERVDAAAEALRAPRRGRRRVGPWPFPGAGSRVARVS